MRGSTGFPRQRHWRESLTAAPWAPAAPSATFNPHSQFSCNPALKALQSPALPASATAGITSLILVLSPSESPWLSAALLKGS